MDLSLYHTVGLLVDLIGGERERGGGREGGKEGGREGGRGRGKERSQIHIFPLWHACILELGRLLHKHDSKPLTGSSR